MAALGNHTLDGIIEASEAVIARSDASTKIIPGHGDLANRSDIQRYHDMLVKVRANLKALVDQGKSEDEALEASVNILREAIHSLIEQTYPRFELIVVDGGSTDDTLSIVDSYMGDDDLRVIELAPGLGIPRALNEGMAAAKGQFIARMDDDDFSLPTRISAQVALLRARPEIDVVGTGLFDEEVAARLEPVLPAFGSRRRRLYVHGSHLRKLIRPPACPFVAWFMIRRRATWAESPDTRESSAQATIWRASRR